jgi:Rod binding domain-containing protein
MDAVAQSQVLSAGNRAQTAAMQAIEQQATALGRRADAAGKAKAVDPAERARREAQLKKVAQDFESIFISHLFERMRAATPKGGFLDSSREHEIFTSMQDQELSKSLAQGGGLGLSRMLFQQLKKSI